MTRFHATASRMLSGVSFTDQGQRSEALSPAIAGPCTKAGPPTPVRSRFRQSIYL
jgi:hypothetical protein